MYDPSDISIQSQILLRCLDGVRQAEDERASDTEHRTQVKQEPRNRPRRHDDDATRNEG